MEKYSEQLKLEAVETYRSGQMGLRATALHHDVGFSSLRKWVAAYEVNGAVGVRTKRRDLYSVNFKFEVLQRVRNEDLLYRQAAALFDIRNFNIIAAWERSYERDGMAGLKPHRPGSRKRTMEEAPLELVAEHCEDDTRTREVLLEELSSLRLESAYLKNSMGGLKFEVQHHNSRKVCTCKNKRSIGSSSPRIASRWPA